MEVIIRWKRGIYERFVAMIRTLQIPPGSTSLYVRYYTEMVEDVLRNQHGVPVNALQWRGWSPPVYSWEVVSRRIWLLIVVRRGGSLWSRLRGRAVIKVTIWCAFPQEPSQSTSGPPQL